LDHLVAVLPWLQHGRLKLFLYCRTDDDDDDDDAEREHQEQCAAPFPLVVGANQLEALENAVDEDEALRNEARAPEAIPLAENGVFWRC
jgi:hypothetical protein